MEAARYRKQTLNIIQCTISVSYVEIYGNDILDLLKQGRRCGSKVSGQGGVLDGNVETYVESVDDIMRLLILGEAQKRKASTAMNSRSSRAHSVFIVSLKQTCVDNGKSIHSKLFLADLGGCEQTKKSMLAAGQSKHFDALKAALEDALKGTDKNDLTNLAVLPVKSDRMREAVYINIGLLSLKSCAEALFRSQHIPYANSKLTMILASGLGGISKTSAIVCASQDNEHSSETINAFKFGRLCRRFQKPSEHNQTCSGTSERIGPRYCHMRIANSQQ